MRKLVLALIALTIGGCAESAPPPITVADREDMDGAVKKFARACLDEAPSFDGSVESFNATGTTTLRPEDNPNRVVRGQSFAVVGDFEGKGSRCGLFISTQNEDFLVDALREEVSRRFDPERVTIYSKNKSFAKRFFIDTDQTEYLFAGISKDFASFTSGDGIYLVSWMSVGPDAIKKD